VSFSTTQKYNTADLMWSAFLNAFVSTGSSAWLTGISVSWTNPGLPTGAGLVLSGMLATGPTAATATYLAAELATSTTWPLAYLGKFPASNPSIKITKGASNQLGALECVQAIQSAWALLVSHMCGLSMSGTSTGSVTRSGAPWEVGAMGVSLTASAVDQLGFSTGVLDLSQVPQFGSIVNENPIMAAVAQQAIPSITIPAQAAQPIPDFEMAINSGGSIFSISSGTFTEP